MYCNDSADCDVQNSIRTVYLEEACLRFGQKSPLASRAVATSRLGVALSLQAAPRSATLTSGEDADGRQAMRSLSCWLALVLGLIL